MKDILFPVIAGGAFTIVGVLVGWVLNEFSAARRAKPALSFELNATPRDDLIEPELRVKESASDYCVEIYNTGQVPFILKGFYITEDKTTLVDCPATDEDLTILPYHKKTYILTQQEARVLERHCKDKDLKECKVVATSVNGRRVKSKLDLSWIHIRVSLQRYSQSHIIVPIPSG